MKKLISTLAIVLFLSPGAASAAVLSVSPSILDSSQKDAYTILLILDTQGQSINTIQGTITISPDLETPADISTANSIVNYWVKEPKAGREIQFAGAIPGGFEGDKGFLLALQFPPRDGGNVTNGIVFGQIKAYLNDGLATPVSVTTKSFNMRAGAVESDLDDQLLALQQSALNDITPPEDFTPQISRDDKVFNGQWFISFNAEDKQSGIDHYQIQESLSGKIDPDKWQNATSPYLLKDQQLHSYVFVQATDKQGNTKVAKLAPQNPPPVYRQYKWPLIGIIIIVVLVLFYKFLKPNAKRKTK